MRKSKIMTRFNERWQGLRSSIDIEKRQTKLRAPRLLIEPPPLSSSSSSSSSSSQMTGGPIRKLTEPSDSECQVGATNASTTRSLIVGDWGRNLAAMNQQHQRQLDEWRVPREKLAKSEQQQVTSNERFEQQVTSSIWQTNDQSTHSSGQKSSNQQYSTSVISQQQAHHRESTIAPLESCFSGQFAMESNCKTSSEMSAREKRRRKGELTSFMMILFGSIVISFLSFAVICHSISQEDFVSAVEQQQKQPHRDGPKDSTSSISLAGSGTTPASNATLIRVPGNLTAENAVSSRALPRKSTISLTANSTREQLHEQDMTMVMTTTLGLSPSSSSTTTTSTTSTTTVQPSTMATDGTIMTTATTPIREQDIRGHDSVALEPSADEEDEEGSEAETQLGDSDEGKQPDKHQARGSKLSKLINESADGLVDVLLEHLRDNRGASDGSSEEARGGIVEGPDSRGPEKELINERQATTLPVSVRRNPTVGPTEDNQNSSTQEATTSAVIERTDPMEESMGSPIGDHLADSQPLLAPNEQTPTAKKVEEADAERHLEMAMETYGRWTATGNELIELFSRKMMPIIVEHGYDTDAATVAGLLQVFNGIRTLKPWALKLLDASAKIAPGLLVGTQSDFGDYDECLNVRVDDPSGFAAANSDFPIEIDPITGLKSTTLVGKYCLADVEFPKPPRRRLANYSQELQTNWAPIELRRPLYNFSQSAAYKDTIFVETANFFHMLYVDPIRVGLCLTNKIDPENFTQVFNKLLEEFRITINFKGRCVTKYDRVQWSLQQRISAYILIAACSLVLISSLLDVIHLKLRKLSDCPAKIQQVSENFHRKLIRYRPLFTSFSIIRNTKRLFKSQKQQQIATANRDSNQQATLAFNQMANEKQQPFRLNQLASQACGTTTATTTVADSSVTNSSNSESSVESSPCIERRSSSMDGSAMNLIIGCAGNGLSSSFFGSPNKQPFAACNGNFGILTQQIPSSRNNSIDSARFTFNSYTTNGFSNINLLSLHGIRVITMSWMIVNHTYLFGGFFVIWAHRRLIDIAEWPKSMSFQLVLNGWLTVETYFFLSAMIIVLNLMPLMKRKKFNYATYIIHRLLRLMPAYVGLVSLNFLWPLISAGPVWLVKGRSFIQTPCENYLWTNFLFINNWIWPEKQCMVHTWFLSADFQLYLIAPVIVYLLYRRPALGHFTNIMVAILASILSGFVIYANKLLPATLINKLEFDSIKQQLSYSYFATYQHMGPYCLGILTGYLLHKRNTIRLPKHLTWSLWLLLPPLSFTTLLLTYLWNGAYDDPDLINPSPIVSALYVAIHRTIWTSLVAWIVFACATGRAKLLSNFLSHSIFIPISRLSFSIYLVHLPVIMFRALNLRHTIEWTDSNILWEACGNFVVSLIMGYFLNIAFESPFINLENFLFGKDKLDDINNGQKRRMLRLESDGSCGNVSVPNSGTANVTGGMQFSSEESQNKSTNKSTAILLASFTNEQTVATTNGDANGKLDEDDKSAETSTSGCFVKDQPSIESNEASFLDPRRSIKKSQEELMDGHLFRASLVRESIRKNYENHDNDESVDNQYKNHQLHNIETRSSKTDSGRGFIRSGTLSASSDLLNNHQHPHHRYPYQVHQKPMQLAKFEQRSRYLLDKQPRDNDVYNIVGEYQHYAPGSYQRWRLNSATVATRPGQYATLARTSRLQPSSLDIRHNQEQPLMQEMPTLMYGHRRRESNRDGQLNSNVGMLSNSRSNFGGLMEYRSTLDDSLVDNHHHGNYQQKLHQRQHQTRHHLMTRRQGRYNTLTGTGTRDWRLRYPTEDISDEQRESQYRWPKQAMMNEQTSLDDASNSLHLTAASATATNWLQPGALIPRIDSSTLRRQTRRQLETTESSIIEEPADDGDNMTSPL